MCAMTLKLLLKLRLNSFLWIFAAVLFFVIIRYLMDNEQDNDELMHGGVKKSLHNQYPGVVWWSSGLRSSSELKTCPDGSICNFFHYEDRNIPKNVGAYLFYASGMNFEDLPLPRRPDHVIWGIFHEESPRNVAELMFEKALSLFNFSSTFSRFSDVPFPLAHMKSLDDLTSKRYYVKTSDKNALLKEISPILFLQSDCDTSTEREDYVKELMKFVNIDSYGECMNNKQLPESLKIDYLNKLHDDETLSFIAKYKFVIAIENGVCEDYITEKLWRAISVGTIPIYFGSPSIKDWLPNNKTAILLEDYPTPKILSNYINKLMQNDSLYEQHLEHKIKGLIRNKKLLSEIELRPYQLDALDTLYTYECFICKQLYSTDKKKKHNIVSKAHYNCPKPISALTLNVNPKNLWVNMWEYSARDVDKLYERILKQEPP